MSAIRLGSVSWMIGCIFACSFIAVAASVRLNDMNYAEAVSRIDYQLCHANAADKSADCAANAKVTYSLIDPGIKRALGSAAVGILLVFMVSGLASVTIVVTARMVRSLSSRARN